MKRTLVAAVLASVFFIAPAFGQSDDYGLYGGVAVGKSAIDAKTSDSVIYFPPNPSAISMNSVGFESENLAWSGFVGYGAPNDLGVELGFWDHGDFKSTLAGPSAPSIGVKEWYLGGTLAFPAFGPISLTGGAGVARAQFDTRGTFRVVAGNFSLPITRPENDTGGYWKVGVSGHFDRLEAGLSFMHRDVGAFELSSATLALSYSF